MHAENDYRDYLEHSMKGAEWKNHKYLYKTSSGRYVYPEDVAKDTDSFGGSGRQLNGFGGSGRKFNTNAVNFSGRSVGTKIANNRKSKKYLNKVLSEASKQAVTKNHGGGKSTIKKKERFKYTWGSLVNPSDYGITRVDTVKETYGGSGRKLKSGAKETVKSYANDFVKSFISSSKKKKVQSDVATSKKKKTKNKNIANQAMKLLSATSPIGKVAYKSYKNSGKTAKKSSGPFRDASRQRKAASSRKF